MAPSGILADAVPAVGDEEGPTMSVSNGGRIRIRRIHDDPDGDTYRVLVDRPWPRGIKKDAAQARPLGQGRGAQRRAPPLVRPRPGQVRRVRAALPGRAEPATGLHRRRGAARPRSPTSRHAAHRHPRHRALRRASPVRPSADAALNRVNGAGLLGVALAALGWACTSSPATRAGPPPPSPWARCSWASRSSWGGTSSPCCWARVRTRGSWPRCARCSRRMTTSSTWSTC
jgi:hypothetical protein